MKFHSDEDGQKRYLQVAVMSLTIILAGSIASGTVNLSNTAEAQTAGTATLIVYTQVVNDNGGTAQASDFTVCILDYGGTNPEPQCFAGSESGTAVTLQASGQGYAVGGPGTNTLGYQGYTSDPDCVRNELSEGSTYYCTMFFDDVSDSEAPQVNITAQDRKGKELSDGSTTNSKDIIIEFTATDNVGVTSVECSLVGPTNAFVKQFSPCTSPIELNKLAKGTYTFRVVATDEAENEGIYTFKWIVKQP